MRLLKTLFDWLVVLLCFATVGVLVLALLAVSIGGPVFIVIWSVVTALRVAGALQ